MTWSSWVAIFGAITGAIGAASGYYSHVLSGYRVKAKIGIAIQVPGGIIKIADNWKGGFGAGVDYRAGSEALYVQVWNHGRMPIDVDRVSVMNHVYRGSRNGEKFSFVQFGGPMGDAKMPHRLTFGSSSTWLIPLMDIVALSKLSIKKPPVRYPVRVKLDMGDDRVVKSKNWLTPQQLDDFMSRWTAYQAGTPEGSSNAKW